MRAYVRPMLGNGAPVDDTAYENCDLYSVIICLLGGFRLFKGGQRVYLGGSKVETLLSNLALQKDFSLCRDTLLQRLWPDCDPALSGQSLNSLMHNMRKMPETSVDGIPFVLAERGHYKLNPEARIRIDVVRFEALIEEGEAQELEGDNCRALHNYQSAVRLYQGDLIQLSNVTSNTDLILERERLRSLYLTIVMRLLRHSYSRGAYRECLQSADLLLASEPCREDVHRFKMLCYVFMGQRALAFRQYQVCVELLMAELGTAPESATINLYDQIRLNPDGILAAGAVETLIASGSDWLGA